jgi:hypothetical protein
MVCQNQKIKAHDFLLFFNGSHNNNNDISHILILCTIEILFKFFLTHNK